MNFNDLAALFGAELVAIGCFSLWSWIKGRV